MVSNRFLLSGCPQQPDQNTGAVQGILLEKTAEQKALGNGAKGLQPDRFCGGDWRGYFRNKSLDKLKVKFTQIQAIFQGKRC